MARILAVVLMAMVVGLPVCAQAQFVGSGDFSATAVLWFAGTEVTARFSGQMHLSGSVEVDGEAVQFTAKGEIHGIGEGDTSTLAGVGWGVFTATGRLVTGEPIEIRGGFTADSSNFSLSTNTAGEGTGSFFALIIIGNKEIEAAGKVGGEASGAFVPPDDPYTMQIEAAGNAQFHANSTAMAGDPETLAKRLPWNLNTWPQEIREELLSLLGAQQEK